MKKMFAICLVLLLTVVSSQSFASPLPVDNMDIVFNLDNSLSETTGVVSSLDQQAVVVILHNRLGTLDDILILPDIVANDNNKITNRVKTQTLRGHRRNVNIPVNSVNRRSRIS